MPDMPVPPPQTREEDCLPQDPRPRRAEETRERIIKAAFKAFSESGFEGASTRQIAALAGENQGLITYHFATKENLWKEAVDSSFLPFAQEIAELVSSIAGQDTRTRLRTLLMQLVRLAAERPGQMRLMVREGNADSPRIKWLIERHIKGPFEMANAILREAIEEGILPPAPHVHYFYMIVGATSLFFTAAPEVKYLTGADTTDPVVIEAHAEAVVNLFLR